MLQPPAVPWVAALFPFVALSYVFAGLFAWTRRPGSHLGLIMVFGGGVWLLAGLANVGSVSPRAGFTTGLNGWSSPPVMPSA